MFLLKDTLPLESLSEFLTALYYGSPPESELNILNALIQEFVKDGRISWVSHMPGILAQVLNSNAQCNDSKVCLAQNLSGDPRTSISRRIK